MIDRIEVRYRRIAPSEHFLVEVVADGKPLGPPVSVNSVQLWAHVQQALEGREAADVFLVRSDAPHIAPYRLGGNLLGQLQCDPTAVAAAFTVPAVRVVQPRPQLMPPARVRKGADILADTFSDDLWCRARKGLVECPVCSRWHALLPDTRCAESQRLTFEARGSKWLSTPVSALLQLPLERIWAPRAWNRAPPWVSRVVLMNLLVQWTKEKGEVECRMQLRSAS